MPSSYHQYRSGAATPCHHQSPETAPSLSRQRSPKDADRLAHTPAPAVPHSPVNFADDRLAVPASRLLVSLFHTDSLEQLEHSLLLAYCPSHHEHPLYYNAQSVAAGFV